MSLSQERQLIEALIKDGAVPVNQIPKSLDSLRSQLCLSGAARVERPKGKRSPYLVALSRSQLDKRLESLSPVALNEDASARSINIQINQDSKQGGRLPYLLLNVMGSEAVTWSCAAHPYGITQPIAKGTYMGLVIDESSADYRWIAHGPVVLVENREAWLWLSKKLPEHLQGAAIIRYEGWLSTRLIEHLSRWTSADIWLFADYDPVGFANLKRLRESGVPVKLLIPELDDSVWMTCGNDKIWTSNLALKPSIDAWIGQASKSERDLWNTLCRYGVALEHEVVIDLENLSWL